MLTIRLQRTGKRGQAYFRVVVVEHTKKPKGEFLELLGSYDPHKKQFQVKKERIDYWVGKGAQASPTVNNLLVNYKYWDKEKMMSWKPKPSSRAQVEGKKKTGETKAEAAPEPSLNSSSEATETPVEEPAAQTPETEQPAQ